MHLGICCLKWEIARAFMVIGYAHEALGEGFRPLTA